ncbi:MAG: tetraacyldisaccharide 4'-kinase [Legionellales bacterium]|nr:tetraacyldisaccharide 4'-kinase [Legionellales bacterium]
MINKMRQIIYCTLHQSIESWWYRPRHSHPILLSFFMHLLMPLSYLYYYVLKCICYFTHPYHPSVPVWVVGNLTVGGSGKSILVMWLVHHLQNQGYRVGVISRGYGRNSKQPVMVTSTSTADEVGDEPLMFFQRYQCPISIAASKVQAIEALTASYQLDVIISDDGFQHFKLKAQRYIEVLHEARHYGNGYVLPLGPLREPLTARLSRSDMRVIMSQGSSTLMNLKSNDFKCDLTAEYWVNVLDNKIHRPVDAFITEKKPIVVMTGIAGADRFFSLIKSMGLNATYHAYPDHHQFSAQDCVLSHPDQITLITEKDAVKCTAFANQNVWALRLKAMPDDRCLSCLSSWMSSL